MKSRNCDEPATDAIAKELSTNILRTRDALGLSQTEVANRIGIDRAVISRYESGKQEPGAVMLGKLANALDTSTDSLLGIDVGGCSIKLDIAMSAIPADNYEMALKSAKAAAEAVLKSFMASP